MKNLKAALKAKQQAKKDVDVSKSAKLSKALKIKAQQFGARIVETAIEAHATTLELLMSCKGKSALELAEIKAAIKQGWKDYAEGITARKSHSDRGNVESMKRASIYNRNSEMQAIISMFEKYAAMNPATRKAFDSKLADVSGYHAAVAFARHFNSGNKSSGSSDETPVAVRERKAWSKKGSERVQKIKATLRFAPLEALAQVEEWIESRIAKLQKAANAQKGSGKVEAIRKAANG